MTRSPAAILLESLVLDAIGCLSADREKLAMRLVHRVFGRPASEWRAALHEEFGLAPEVARQIAAMWAHAQEVAATKGVELEPEAFARMVVEENFSDAVEMVGTEILSDLE